MINHSTTQRNYKRLVEYDQLQQESTPNEGRRKLTLNIDLTFHDVVKRMALIEGTTKTEIIRRAIDAYAELFGAELLYPSASQI